MPGWYVRNNNSEPVGPVDDELVLRGIRAGKIPTDAEVCRLGDAWCPILSVEVFRTAFPSGASAALAAYEALPAQAAPAPMDFVQPATPAYVPAPYVAGSPATAKSSSSRLVVAAIAASVLLVLLVCGMTTGLGAYRESDFYQRRDAYRRAELATVATERLEWYAVAYERESSESRRVEVRVKMTSIATERVRSDLRQDRVAEAVEFIETRAGLLRRAGLNDLVGQLQSEIRANPGFAKLMQARAAAQAEAARRGTPKDHEDAIADAKQLLLESLKAPGSASFEKARIVYADHPRYIVHLIVDAQNSFGAYIREGYLVALKLKPGTDQFSYNKLFAVQRTEGREPTSEEVTATKGLNWSPSPDPSADPPSK